jgi:fructokinase
MNVAFHTNQLGMEAKMISRIGNDVLGKELKKFLENMGVSTDLIQTDETFPTGVVNVTFDSHGSPAYEIVSPVAWDFISLDEKAEECVRNADALVFGSLACRTEGNKKTLLEYMEIAPVRVFDINLRTPFYTQAVIEELLAKSDILKMNDEECSLLAGWVGAPGDEKTQLNFIKNKFGLEVVILTKGKDGAVCLSESGYFEQPGFPIKVQDTIGSGDAFLAAFLSKYLQEESTRDCLAFAAAVGALVATKRGGTPNIRFEEIEKVMSYEL